MDANTLYFEPMVTAFLSADPRIFVSPQYQLVLEPSGDADQYPHSGEKLQWPDVVAVRPWDDMAFLVKITTRATNFKPIAKKVGAYVREKEKYLERLRAECNHRFRDVEPWVFLRQPFYETFQKHYMAGTGGSRLKRVTALEVVAQPWTYLVKERRIEDHLLELEQRRQP